MTLQWSQVKSQREQKQLQKLQMYVDMYTNIQKKKFHNYYKNYTNIIKIIRMYVCM